MRSGQEKQGYCLSQVSAKGLASTNKQKPCAVRTNAEQRDARKPKASGPTTWLEEKAEVMP